MSTITNFHCVDEKAREIPCDAFGNNVAIQCPSCGHPVLAIARENQRGSSAQNPAVCRSCSLRFWVSVDNGKRLLRLNSSS
jgi:transcription elongation factor Elf1